MNSEKHKLDFEKPIVSIMREIERLEEAAGEEYDGELEQLRSQLVEIKHKIYSGLQPHQRLQLARHPERPHTVDYVPRLGTNWRELHGDRQGHDDPSIVGGLLELQSGLPIMLVGTEKGNTLRSRQQRNFGMPQPWGYRKALRLFEHANAFGIPIVTLIDTPGAYPGLEAEAENQSGAIAKNLREMSNLKVPVVAVITGEGGSGGALGLAVANSVLMMEHAVYSVISPEGCAAILWRTRDKAAEASQALKITAPQLLEEGLIDDIIPEAQGGAHNDPDSTAANLGQAILGELRKYTGMSAEEITAHRKSKFRHYGVFEDIGSGVT